MHDEQRLAKLADGLRRIVALEVVEELLAHVKRPPADVDGRLAFAEELFLVANEMLDVMRIVRRADRRHRPRLSDPLGGRKRRRAPEAVPDEDLRRTVVVPEVVRG